MQRRGLLLALLFAAGLLPAGARETSAQLQRAPARDRPLPVQVQDASVGRIGRAVTAMGTLFPDSEVKLMSQAEAQLLEVLAREGDRVRPGQLLARLDTTLHRIQLALAESELATAGARLKKLEAGYLPEEISAAEAEVNQVRAALRRSEAEVASARARLEEAETNAKALEAVFRQGVISRQQWITATTQASRARADLEERQARLVEDAARIRAAEERLKLKQLGSRKEDIEAARGEMQQARQKVQLLRAQLEYFSIRSPIAGVVTERKVEPGDLAVNRAHLFTLADVSTLRVRGQVSELDLPRLRRGQPAVVELDAYPGRRFRGRLAQLFPQVDPRSRQGVAEVELPNRDHALQPGLLARLTFEPALGQEAIILPAHAVVWGDGTDPKSGHVFVLKPAPPAPPREMRGGRPEAAPRAGPGEGRERGRGDRAGGGDPGFLAEKRAVRLGENVDGKVEILEGLRAGEKVIVSATGELRDGRLVRVVSE